MSERSCCPTTWETRASARPLGRPDPPLRCPCRQKRPPFSVPRSRHFEEPPDYSSGPDTDIGVLAGARLVPAGQKSSANCAKIVSPRRQMTRTATAASCAGLERIRRLAPDAQPDRYVRPALVVAKRCRCRSGRDGRCGRRRTSASRRRRAPAARPACRRAGCGRRAAGRRSGRSPPARDGPRRRAQADARVRAHGRRRARREQQRVAGEGDAHRARGAARGAGRRRAPPHRSAACTRSRRRASATTSGGRTGAATASARAAAARA